jgi:hypothetical protein
MSAGILSVFLAEFGIFCQYTANTVSIFLILSVFQKFCQYLSCTDSIFHILTVILKILSVFAVFCQYFAYSAVKTVSAPLRDFRRRNFRVCGAYNLLPTLTSLRRRRRLPKGAIRLANAERGP